MYSGGSIVGRDSSQYHFNCVKKERITSSFIPTQNVSYLESKLLYDLYIIVDNKFRPSPFLHDNFKRNSLVTVILTLTVVNTFVKIISK